MSKKQLQVFASLGAEYSVGWMRDDLPMIHVFAQAKLGHMFTPSNGVDGGPHWPCKVCAAHNYTEVHFTAQIQKGALQKGPV